MKKIMTRIISAVLLVTMFLGIGPVTDLTGLFPISARADSDNTIPKPFELGEERLGTERASGLWRYALRERDGLAVITDYLGTEEHIALPLTLDGTDVVGVASMALTGRDQVELHTNIYFIAEDAFGRETLPSIMAPNGSYGIWWADNHGCSYETGKDYTLVPGVIDYTDFDVNRVQKRGENHVAFGKTEAMGLSVGSIFFMRDTRGMEFYFRVLELTELEDRIVATVEIPDAAEAMIDYETTVVLELTEEDFTPADGVTVGDAAAGTKTVAQSSASESNSFHKDLDFYTKKSGNNDSTKFKITGSVDYKTTDTVIYTVKMKNGACTKCEMTKITSTETTVGFSCKDSENLIKELSEAEKTVETLAAGEKPTPEKTSLLKKIGGLIGDKTVFDVNDTASGGTYMDYEAAKKALTEIDEYKEQVRNKTRTKETMKMGDYHVQTPYGNIDISLAVDISITGTFNYTWKSSNITKQHYNFNTEEWEKDYTNGNQSSNESSKALKGQVEGKICFSVEVSFGVWVVKAISFKVELGIVGTVSKTVEFDSGGEGILVHPLCSQFKLEPYMSIEIYAGFWLGKGTGFKHAVYTKTWTFQELIGREYLLCTHINLALDNKIHEPDDCPYNNICKVKYNTKSSILIQDKKILKGRVLTPQYAVNLSKNEQVLADDWEGGQFLGWAWEADDTEPTAWSIADNYDLEGNMNPNAAFKNPDLTDAPVKVEKNLTLYAVWENQIPVHFDSKGGTAVPDQLVAKGGYVTRPSNPTKEGNIFLGWMYSKGKEWDFNRNTVSKERTLTAEWADGTELGGGTEEVAYIGDYDLVSEDCKFTPSESDWEGQSSLRYFTYEEIEDERFEGLKGWIITGIRNDPEHLVVPKTLPAPFGAEESTWPVMDIRSFAFQNCESLRSVRFLTEDMPQFDTSGWFEGCTNLEYVELPQLEDGIIGPATFEDCSNLKCVKLRSGTVSIGSGAFKGTGLTRADIPYGIGSIGSFAFSDSKKLERIVIPDSVEVFQTVPDDYGRGYRGPLYGCTAIKEISIGGIDTLTNGMLKTGSEVLEKLEIRGTVKKIGEAALYSGSEYTANVVWSNGYHVYRPGKKVELIIGEGVETIGSSAFSGCKMFTSVSLPSTLISIGNNAFHSCSNFKDLDLGESITTIGAYAFADCTSLEAVYIPDSVKSIGVGESDHSSYGTYYKGPFSGCTGLKEISIGGVDKLECGMLYTGSTALKKLTIRRSVGTIGNYALLNHLHTKRVQDSGYETRVDHDVELYIEDGVKSIGAYAFYKCNMFTSISLPNSLKSIGREAFYECTGLKKLACQSVNTIAEGAFYGCSELSGDITLLNVKTIENDTFLGCSKIESVTLSSADTISDDAFRFCENLKKIEWKKKLKSIGNYAFAGCSALKELNLQKETELETIGNGAFQGCKSLEKLFIPDSVEELGVDSFTNCKGLRELSVGGVQTITREMLKTDSVVLEKLTIRGTVNEIGDYALCTREETASVAGIDSGYGAEVDHTVRLVIENGVKRIGDYALYQAKMFNSFSLPDSLTSIGSHAFAFCTGMEEIEIKKKVTTIGEFAFSECTNLRQVKIGEDSKLETISRGAFQNCSSLTSLYIPDSVRTIEVWDYDGDFGVRVYSRGPFHGCTALREISIGGVNTLENGMLRTGSKALNKLTIRGTIKNIGDEALWDSGYDQYPEEQVELIIEEGVETIGEYAFSGCSVFTRIAIPSTIRSIGREAFSYRCGAKMTIDCPDLTMIGSSAFEGCDGLTEVKLEHVENIGKNAFLNCSSLERVYVSGNNVTLAFDEDNCGPFMNCPNLRSFCIGGVDTITPGMLKTGSENLQELTILGTVKNIGAYAFDSENQYSNGYGSVMQHPTILNIEEGVETIGEYAFYGCKMFQSVSIPSSVSIVGDYAFANCSEMTDLFLSSQNLALGTDVFSACNNMIIHIAAENESIVDYCEAHSISWDLATEFPHTLTLVNSSGETDTRIVNWREKLNLQDPTWDDHHFSGWFFDDGLQNKWTSDTMPACDLTLYAGWDLDQYTVTLFIEHDIVELAFYPGDILELPVPTREGHVFSGWYEDYTLTKKWTLTRMPLRNPYLYASWDIGVNKLIMMLNGGSVDNRALNSAETDNIEIYAVAGENVSLLTPVREGFRFAGWTTDEAGKTSFDGVMPEDDTILFAQWKPYSSNGVYRNDGDHMTLLRYVETEDEERIAVLPETVDGLPLTRIEAGAFRDSRIESLYLSKNIAEIEAGAFTGSSYLSELIVSENNPVFKSEDGVIYSKDGTELLFFPPAGSTSIVLPDDTVRIGAFAFDATELLSIELNEGLLEIGERAFRDTGISSIVFPESLQIIGERAFTECENLSYVKVDGMMSLIGEYAFSGCNNSLVAYGAEGDSVLCSAIRDRGYLYNAYILTVVEPTRVTETLYEAGNTITLPENPRVPENCQFTGWYLDETCTEDWSDSVMPAYELTLYGGTRTVFEYDTLTETVEDPDDPAQTKTETVLSITNCLANGNEISIPEQIGGDMVRRIAAGAFGESYTKVTVPGTIEEIEEGAFAPGTVIVCSSDSYAQRWTEAYGFIREEQTWTLNFETGYGVTADPVTLHKGDNIVLPELTRSGYELQNWYWDAAFTDVIEEGSVMPDREMIAYAEWHVTDASLAELSDSLIWDYNENGIAIIGYAGAAESIVLPSALHGFPVTEIGANAFAYNQNITEIVLPNTISELGERAFFAMYNLATISLPSNVSSIPPELLSCCGSLNEVVIPEGVTSIGREAFSNSGLYSIILPASLNTIDSSAFRNCAMLSEISVAPENRFFESVDNVLYDIADGVLVKYPPAKNDETYSVRSDTWSIGNYAFEGARRLKAVSIGEAYSIGNGAFRGCIGLTDLPELNSIITRIPEECFYGCSGLREITIPTGIKQIGARAFINSGITQITLPSTVTDIGIQAVDRSVLLRGEAESYAETWAEENGYMFVTSSGELAVQLSFVEENIQMKRGERLQTSVAVEPSWIDLTAIEYASSDSSIVKIDNMGTLYAVGCGSATVYAFMPGGAIAYMNVTVCVLDITDLELNPVDLPYNGKNQRQEALAQLLKGTGLVEGENCTLVCDEGEDLIHAGTYHFTISGIEPVCLGETTGICQISKANIEASYINESFYWIDELQENSDIVLNVDVDYTLSFVKDGTETEVSWPQEDGCYEAYINVEESDDVFGARIAMTCPIIRLDEGLVFNGKTLQLTMDQKVFLPGLKALTKGGVPIYTLVPENTVIDVSGDLGLTARATGECRVSVTVGDKILGSCRIRVTNMNTMIMPLGLQQIGKKAFIYNSAIERIVMGSGVTMIGESAFAFINTLKQVVIPSGATSIATDSFYPNSPTIICKENSNAEAYAKANGFPYAWMIEN